MNVWQKAFILIYGILSIALLIATAVAAPKDRRVDAIHNYRGWTKINDKPLYMEPAVSALCSGPRIQDQEPNPHVPRYFTVYVNDLGRKAMFAKDANFPTGSVIVKEKYAAVKQADGKYALPDLSRKPELLTVMVKHDAGYDKANGDWEFFTCDGNGTPAPKESVKHCQDCHRNTGHPNHLFRSYMPGMTGPGWHEVANLLSQI